MTANFPDTSWSGGLPEHLIRLSGCSWALWRWSVLRGAGFPASEVLKLSSPACATAADDLLMAENHRDQARRDAIGAVSRELNSLEANQGWGDKPKRGLLLNARIKLKAEKLPKPATLPAGVALAVEKLGVELAAVEAARQRYLEEHSAAVARSSAAIREAVSANQLREAIIWQNRRAHHNAVAPLLLGGENGTNRGFQQRQREELVANYLQRYCLKNDTIGFFGPVCWAALGTTDAPIVARPGPKLIASRRVYFEAWCIDALAETVAANVDLRKWLAPRRMPYLHMVGSTLYLPTSSAIVMPAKQTAVLKSCAGDRIAKEIVQDLLANTSLGYSSAEEIYAILEKLVADGLITWTIEVPIGSHPERDVRALFERIEEEGIRRTAIGALDELESARDLVAGAAGDARKLDEALSNLETTFTRLTGRAPTRAAGQIYAGRTLAFEDCERDLHAEIGAELLKDIERPLAILLASARWITHRSAEEYRKSFDRIYANLSRQTNSRTLSASNFWIHAQRSLLDNGTRTVELVESLLQDKWAEVLSIPGGQRRVSYTSEELRPRIEAAFDAPLPGWQYARYHSPDVMIAASSIAAIERGEYLCVLGELHVGMNTVGAALFVDQHPVPEEVSQAFEQDFPEPRLVPVPAKTWENATHRTRFALMSPRDFRLLVGHDCIVTPEMKTVPLGDMVVAASNDSLVVQTRDGRLQFELIDVIGDLLSMSIINSLTILRPEAHTPRVTIDRMVVCREAWRFAAAELEFAFENDEAARFIGARRWAQSHDLPRSAFVKVRIERKPFYLDFDSPIFVEIFTKAVRRACSAVPDEGSVTISEMLPRMDQLWLPDAEGRRYTSELRFVAVDLASIEKKPKPA